MLQRIFYALVFILCFAFTTNASSIGMNKTSDVERIEKPKPIRAKFFQFLERSKEARPKLTAVVITATLGPFGAHRIYLGTHYTVPLFYTITLGGGLGVLPASDLLVLIFSKDITKYYDNSKIFMWDVD